MALESFKMNARMGTQPYPCGEWHGDNGSTFRISADGSYEQKRSSSISTVVVHQPSKNGDVSKIRAIQRNGNHKVDLILRCRMKYMTFDSVSSRH